MQKFILLVSILSAAGSGVVEFISAGPVMSGGLKLDVGSYAAPLMVDWNGDGNQDLICGQFDYGRIRFYPNVGTGSAPVFNGFSYLLDGASFLSVPYG